MNPIVIMLIGAICVGGIAWQIYLIKEVDRLSLGFIFLWEDVPKRVKIPFLFGASAFAGCILYSGFAIFTRTTGPISTIDDGISLSFKALVFWFAATFKSYFSAAVLAFMLSFAVFNYFEHGEIALIPIMSELVQWLFSTTSKTLYWIYVGIWFTYLLGTSVLESFEVY